MSTTAMETLSTNTTLNGEASPSEKDSNFEKRTMRLVDLRILSIFGLIFALLEICRSSFGLARVAGMGKDLDLSRGNRFSILGCAHAIAHPLGEIPSTFLLRRLGPPVLLTFCIISTGIIQLSMGFVSDWRSLLMCRILLGIVEGPSYPTVSLLISSWYTKFEMQRRLAFFFFLSLLCSGFGPILAYVLSRLDGKRGLHGWSWIFIIEGAITASLGVLAWIYVPELPDRNTFLTPAQTQLVLKRTEDDRGHSIIPDEITPKKILSHLKDWTIWAHGGMLSCGLVPLVAMGYFLPTILSGMGWSEVQSLLLSAPPPIYAAFSILVFSYWSDRSQWRAPFIAAQVVMSLVGLVITAYSPSNTSRYIGTFLIFAGSASTTPSIATYATNNVNSYSKRATTTMLMVTLAAAAGVIAPTAFRQKDFPHYMPGIWVAIGCQFLFLVLLLLTTMHYWRMNNSIRAGALGTVEGKPGPGILYAL